jgi:hypothetical protein
MASLGDFVGQLLTEIANARLQADQEAIRIAHLYAGDALLRHLPVPHFRLPELTLDIPVLVQAVGAPRPVAREALGRRMEAAFQRVLREELAGAGRRPAAGLDRRLRARVREARAAAHREAGLDPVLLAERLSDAARDELGDPEPGEAEGPGTPMPAPAPAPAPAPVRPATPSLTGRGESGAAAGKEADGPTAAGADLWARVRQRASSAMAEVLPAPPPLDIVATTAAVRGAQPESLLRLKLTVREQNLEWAVVNDGGATRARLVHE